MSVNLNKFQYIMKHYFFNLFSILIGTLVFLMSCADKETVFDDYAPVNFTVKVVNASGQNLLDESVPGNILGEDISVTYKDKDYPMIIMPPSGRYYAPQWYGVVLYDGEELTIGEFNGAARHEECILHIGARDIEIYYDAKISKDDVKRKFYFDGKRCDGPDFVLRL